jgi:hypothetical protein
LFLFFLGVHFCFDFWGGLYCFNFLSSTLYWVVSVFIIIIILFFLDLGEGRFECVYVAIVYM